jgi:multidrug efflux pump subunit AcrB
LSSRARQQETEADGADDGDDHLHSAGLAFRRVDEALLILMSLPFALVGGIWFLYWQGFHMSVATGTGFIALAGVAAEFGVVMLMYLRHAIEAQPALSHRDTFTEQGLDDALYHGAVLRVRPKAMTVAVIIAACCPFLGNGGRVRGHEPDSGADDWRDDHGAAVIAVYYSCGITS